MRLSKTKIFTVIIFLIYILYFAAEYFFIPNNINLTAGENYTLNFNSPFKAALSPKTMETIYINNKSVNAEDNISLDKGFDLRCNEGSADLKVSFMGITLKNVEINAHKPKSVYAIGRTAGICVDTKGVLVLGTGEVRDNKGNVYEPLKNVLQSGDIITAVNGAKVYSNSELQSAIKDSNIVNISYLRDNKTYNASVNTVASKEDNTRKIGVWVRDSTQGIGTITYYDPDTGRFGALGHPIIDVDTGKIIEIESGELLKSDIKERQIGQKGTPGALIGILDFGKTIGTIDKNNNQGIYGNINKDFVASFNPEKYDIAYKSEVKKGDAYILANIDGERIKKYKIKIENINRFENNSSKNFSISVNDKELIYDTGGIVQGMSGCPIIQNNKIIGAVTHVLVNNPQKGYGIFIENMINN